MKLTRLVASCLIVCGVAYAVIRSFGTGQKAACLLGCYYLFIYSVTGLPSQHRVVIDAEALTNLTLTKTRVNMSSSSSVIEVVDITDDKSAVVDVSYKLEMGGDPQPQA